MVEFRFKGPICDTMGPAESWLSQPDLNERFRDFGLRYWATRKFAVWAPVDRAGEFWHEVTQLLKAMAPKGSKLYQRPADLSESHLRYLNGSSTPPVLTP